MMHADDTIIQRPRNIVGNIKSSLPVQYIGLGAIEYTDTEAPGLAESETAEIRQAGTSGTGRSMIADSQSLYSAKRGFPCQIRDSVVSTVAAGTGVGVQIGFEVSVLEIKLF